VRGIIRWLASGLLACLAAFAWTAEGNVPASPSPALGFDLPAPAAVFTPESPQAPDPPPLRRATIALTGDVLPHNSVWQVASTNDGGFDFSPLFTSVKPTLQRADLAICHLETPLATESGPFSSYPLFSAPPQVAEALKQIGYDACSTASNHAVDQGFAGVTQTLEVLDQAGLKHAGTARRPAEATEITYLETQGLQIALLSYTFGTNGMPVDTDKPWSVNLIDPKQIKRDAARAVAGGADGVLVALHWGHEYQSKPSDYQRDIARTLIRDRNITLIYGHHAHVVQPIEQRRGTWVIWGLGNFLADQASVAPGVDRGAIALVTLRETTRGKLQVTKVGVRPTLIDSSAHAGSMRVLDVRRELLAPGTSADLRVLLTDVKRTVTEIMRPN
jgi:poly-gamma-glutamate capsule biosynthesis protein CapA/YwtB (metallophosphatase superfamily)